MSVCLFLIYAVVLLSDFSISKIILLIATSLSAMGADLLFAKIRKKNLFVPSAAATSSFIIVLLTDPSLPIYIPISAAVLAMFSKNFIRRGRHIFNPAAFGLVLTSVIFLTPVAWWGPGSLFGLSAKFLPLFLILLSPILVSGIRMKRYFTILFFLVSYTASNLIFLIVTKNTIDASIILRLIWDPTIIFFAIVMAPEPMTTPYSRKNQILFGVFIGLLAITSSRLLSLVPVIGALDSLILSLLVGNLLFFKQR